MKRTKNIDLCILTLLAASFSSACSAPPPDVKHCVDENGTVVDDAKCNQPAAPGVHIPFRWYYSTGRLFSLGNRVTGGSYTPSPGRSYSPRISVPSSVSRGGFGSSGRSFSSGSFGGGS